MEFLTSVIDLVLHLDVHLNALIVQYGNWVYAILFLIIFCETGLVIFPFLPGDSLLFVAGALAAAGSGLEIGVLMLVLFTAAVIGDNTNYWIGRTLGARVWTWKNSRFFNLKAFEKTHAFFEVHGGKTIIMARFIPLVRTFAPFVAGVAAMTYRRFVMLDLLGGVIWIGSLCLLGYFFGNIPQVKQHLGMVILTIIGVSVLPVALGAWRARRQVASSGEI